MDLFFKTRSFKVIENFSKLLGLSFLWIAHLFQRRTSPSETLLMLAKNVKDNDPINESENVIKLEPIPGFPVSKANHNLEKIISRSKEVDFENKTPIVLVTTGAFSPIHFEHIKMFEVAKEYLESNHSCYVLGGLISPSHDEYIQSKLKKNFISKAHRLKMCELALKDSNIDWISVDHWESSLNHFVSFEVVCMSIQSTLSKYQSLPKNTKVYYVCGADIVMKCGLELGLMSLGVITVGRKNYSAEHLKQFTLVTGEKVKFERQDEFIFCDKELSSTSSTLVRSRIENDESIEDLTFPSVIEYLNEHSLWRN